MSFKQFNIYNRVHAPDYANTGAKSYGTNSFTTTEVVVGTSSKNSHEFLKHETKKIVHDDGTMTFEFWLDDNCIKECVYDIKQKKVISNTTLVSTRIKTKAVA